MAYEKVSLTDEQRAALEEKHEDLLVLDGDPEWSPWTIALRRPTPKETRGYKAHAKRDSTTANDELIRRLAVFPDPVSLDKILERWALTPDFIADRDSFKKFLGGGIEESRK